METNFREARGKGKVDLYNDEGGCFFVRKNMRDLDTHR